MAWELVKTSTGLPWRPCRSPRRIMLKRSSTQNARIRDLSDATAPPVTGAPSCCRAYRSATLFPLILALLLLILTLLVLLILLVLTLLVLLVLLTLLVLLVLLVLVLLVLVVAHDLISVELVPESGWI